MSIPLSYCDISARYGQMPAPQQTLAEQTGWNPKQFFTNYLLKVQEQKEKDAKQAEEDALMAMIDAMNASEEDKEAGKTDMAAANSLADAGKAIIAQHETVEEDGTKRVAWFDPTQTLTIQVLMSCLGDRFTFEQADKIQENQDKVQEDKEQEDKEDRLEVTEAHSPSKTSDPTQTGKEV